MANSNSPWHESCGGTRPRNKTPTLFLGRMMLFSFGICMVLYCFLFIYLFIYYPTDNIDFQIDMYNQIQPISFVFYFQTSTLEYTDHRRPLVNHSVAWDLPRCTRQGDCHGHSAVPVAMPLTAPNQGSRSWGYSPLLWGSDPVILELMGKNKSHQHHPTQSLNLAPKITSPTWMRV